MIFAFLQATGTREERTVTANEFERLGGRGTTKKWRSSCRQAMADGTEGVSVARWLQCAGAHLGKQAVGMPVSLYWPADDSANSWCFTRRTACASGSRSRCRSCAGRRS